MVIPVQLVKNMYNTSNWQVNQWELIYPRLSVEEAIDREVDL